ncbi:hypothetical protein [Jannaschia sp. CCS1]|uniref:hypothetical protein n=1 Tax=Jannaschia sp. (strain CCS1) TaxID=290400 RepID=UPI000053CFB9|nr:hypothetical protein [Jannaschia sp. CCS1]ABD53086.1 hypothetical protein Jann_0169 [Jannaschia sp. CCS1]
MRVVFISLVLSFTIPFAAHAQQLIASYYTTLGPNDHYNSSGTRLGDFGAILQQDRANVHRFGIYDSGDQSDPIFGSLQNRSLIPSIWRFGPSAQGIPNRVVQGHQAYIFVEIFGFGGTPQIIVVHQGAG